MADWAQFDDGSGCGTLRIHSRALTSLATRAAAQTPGVGRAQPRVGGIVPSPRPSASVQVSGRRVRVRLQVDAKQGAPVSEVASAVRSHVTTRLAQLAGMEVTAVDVHVAGVVPAGTNERRVR